MKKRLAIIGGMGTSAGVNMLIQLVAAVERKNPMNDSDFPDFIYFNVPAGGMDEHGVTDGDVIKAQLKTALGYADDCRCHYAIVGCNTVHAFLSELQENRKVNILDMIELACACVPKRVKKVGVLSSEQTKRLRLYDNQLQASGTAVIYTNEYGQSLLDSAIKAVIGNYQQPDHCQHITEVATRLIQQGAEVILLACTELPLVTDSRTITVPVIDAGKVTIEHALSLL